MKKGLLLLATLGAVTLFSFSIDNNGGPTTGTDLGNDGNRCGSGPRVCAANTNLKHP